MQFRPNTDEGRREEIIRGAGGRLALRLRLVRALAVGARDVAAAAAMLRKEHSSWDIGDISSRLRKQGDKLKALKGKTASGKRLNINRALG